MDLQRDRASGRGRLHAYSSSRSLAKFQTTRKIWPLGFAAIHPLFPQVSTLCMLHKTKKAFMYISVCVFFFFLLLTSMLVAQGIVEEDGEEEKGATREANQRRRPRRVVQNTHKVNGVVVQRDLWSGQGSGQVMSGGGLARKFNFGFYLVYVTRHFFFLVPSIPPSTHTHTHRVLPVHTILQL